MSKGHDGRIGRNCAEGQGAYVRKSVTGNPGRYHDPRELFSRSRGEFTAIWDLEPGLGLPPDADSDDLGPATGDVGRANAWTLPRLPMPDTALISAYIAQNPLTTPLSAAPRSAQPGGNAAAFTSLRPSPDTAPADGGSSARGSPWPEPPHRRAQLKIGVSAPLRHRSTDQLQ
jgi:hypothetical protein